MQSVNARYELFTLLVYVCLYTMFLNVDNGVSLLVISELTWSTIYGAYVLVGALLNSAVFVSMALPILIIASIDCGV